MLVYFVYVFKKKKRSNIEAQLLQNTDICLGKTRLIIKRSP